MCAGPLSWRPAVAADRTADVHGDDERDRYVGTGGLILPGSVDVASRRAVAGCTDCRWRLTTPCLVSALGHAFDGESPCTSVVRGCPGDRQLLRAWLLEPGRPWRDVALVCIGDPGPVTVQQVGRAAVDGFVQGMPPQRPTFQPSRGVVAQVPVVFASGQPAGRQSHSFAVLGTEVELDATPSWMWEFGDGASMATGDPGGAHPHDAVAHPYRRAGEYAVTVVTRWTAIFTVDGLGPFPVSEAVSQRDRLDLTVGEGRALLEP